MGEGHVARLLAAVFTGVAAVPLPLAAGIDSVSWNSPAGALQVLVVLLVTAQVAEVARRLVWAAEDVAPLLPYLPALAVCAVVPALFADHLGLAGTAVAICSLAVSLLTWCLRVRSRAAATREAVRS